MKQPINNQTEILLTLIRKRKVSIMDFPYLSGFRTRVSELKTEQDLNLKTDRVQSVNKFGNTYTYVQHSLPESERQKAVDLYKKLVK